MKVCASSCHGSVQLSETMGGKARVESQLAEVRASLERVKAQLLKESHARQAAEHAQVTYRAMLDQEVCSESSPVDRILSHPS